MRDFDFLYSLMALLYLPYLRGSLRQSVSNNSCVTCLLLSLDCPAAYPLEVCLLLCLNCLHCLLVPALGVGVLG